MDLFTEMLGTTFRDGQWVQWEAVLDERTTADCRELHECCFVWPKAPIPRAGPPKGTHPNCRCSLTVISTPYVTILADIRKFTEYLFDKIKYNDGKAELMESWGFSIEDSKALRMIYMEQAKEKYQSGDYTLGYLDNFGQRITMIIDLTDKDGIIRHVNTGWQIRANGTISLNTPFT
ncbi:phage head morphogenesis protein [Eubacteriales bacterium OttesenSCG-928-M02]|nr:phage head morphogenesis protein [Eubacteriales bacterium OttesenSCG-928-M02]